MQPEKHSSSAPETEGRPNLVLGYVTTSPRHPDETQQVTALNAAGCSRIYFDHANDLVERSELAKLLASAHPGDTLVIWRLNSLARSLKEVVARINAINDRGIHFRSITEGLDTTTDYGQVLLTVTSALAQAEKHYRREQAQPGLAAAKAKGCLGGRPPVMTPRMKRAAWQLRHRGQSPASIATTLGVSRETIDRTLTRYPGGG